jgi:hypothetical protein
MRKILPPQKPRCVQWAVRPPLRRNACRGQQDAHDEIVLCVVIINRLAAILFTIGYVLFGVAMIKTATPHRWSGALVARRHVPSWLPAAAALCIAMPRAGRLDS